MSKTSSRQKLRDSLKALVSEKSAHCGGHFCGIDIAEVGLHYFGYLSISCTCTSQTEQSLLLTQTVTLLLAATLVN